MVAELFLPSLSHSIHCLDYYINLFHLLITLICIDCTFRNFSIKKYKLIGRNSRAYFLYTFTVIIVLKVKIL